MGEAVWLNLIGSEPSAAQVDSSVAGSAQGDGVVQGHPRCTAASVCWHCSAMLPDSRSFEFTRARLWIDNGCHISSSHVRQPTNA